MSRKALEAAEDVWDSAKAFADAKRRPSDPVDSWRRYLHAARQQALFLGRSGRIAILRKGKPVDPTAPVKGVIRLSAPAAGTPVRPVDG